MNNSPVHLVQQITPFTCGLACIESISFDEAKKPMTQREMLTRYKGILSKDLNDEKDFGSTSITVIQDILRDFGLGSFHGHHFDRQIVEVYLTSHKYALIFTYDPQGDHTYRFDCVNPDGSFKVMNPRIGQSEDLSFGYLISKKFEMLLIDSRLI